MEREVLNMVPYNVFYYSWKYMVALIDNPYFTVVFIYKLLLRDLKIILNLHHFYTDNSMASLWIVWRR
jgi:hypothetical protein